MHLTSHSLLCWPDQLPKIEPKADLIFHACWLLRSLRWMEAEAVLLNGLVKPNPRQYLCQWLLAYLYCQKALVLLLPAAYHRLVAEWRCTDVLIADGIVEECCVGYLESAKKTAWDRCVCVVCS